MDFLAGSLEKTIVNLQEKKNFLLLQRDRYVHVRQQVLELKDKPHDDFKDGNMLMLGDVIISSEKMFVNVGCEYYVEKSREELLDHVEEKCKLIEQAIEQFDVKIKDGHKALEDFASLLESEQSLTQREECCDEELPSMEIREELDEDGNVINSNVTPTLSSLRQNKSSENGPAENKLADFEQNLKGKLIEKVPQKGLELDNNLSSFNFDERNTENMYTFADLVRQMDEQDEIEDELGSGEVEYDFESFERSYGANNGVNNYGTQDSENFIEGYVDDDDGDDNDDNDDDDIDNQYMVAPTMEAHNAFMDQLKALREKRANQRKNEKPKAAVKSILKTSTDGKERPKKSVGFASTLDIHEVENLKQDNLRNRHNYSSYFMQARDHETDDEERPIDGDFDSELFAQLIGARGPDEIHDKYRGERSQEEFVDDSVSAISTKRKTKVSRFKQERKIRDDDPPHELVQNFRASTSHSATAAYNVENMQHSSSHTDDAGDADDDSSLMCGDIIGERDVNGSAVVDLVVEKDAENLLDSDVTDVNDMDTTIGEKSAKSFADASARIERASTFSKNMRSLKRSATARKPSQNPTPVDEISELSEDLSDTPSDPETRCTEPKDKSPTDSFPIEIMDTVRDKTDAINLPNVDYAALGENLDDMVKAYSLGVYDNDLDEDPGVLLEGVDDFKQYNKQVEELQDDIEAFKIANPMNEAADDQEASDENGPIMTEVKENDIPKSYSEAGSEDDLSLEPSRLRESIVIEYSRLRQAMSAKNKNIEGDLADRDDESKQLEPIDENGTPIKVSRFRSQRLSFLK